MHMSRAAAALLAIPLLWAASTHAVAAPPATPQATPACPAIPLAGADARAIRTPSAETAWGGTRTGNEATLSNRVVAYAIDAELDPVRHTITGKQRLTWRNRSAQPVCSVYVHLYLNGFDGPGSTFMTEQRASESGFRSNVDTRDGEYGYIRLDGADSIFSHIINETDLSKIKVGMRVRAVFKDKKDMQGNIQDILHLEIIG